MPLSPAVFVADHLRPAAKAAGLAIADGHRQCQFPKECALRCAGFLAVALCVEIQRRLNPTVTQDALHGLGLDLCFIHQPVPPVP